MSSDRPHVGIVTGARSPTGTDDDAALAESLDGHGIDAGPVRWDRDRDWTVYDAVIVRSCWEYHEHVEQFRDWLDTVAAAETAVCNPVDALRWNHHKFYLDDLARRGVDVLATAFVERVENRSVASVLAERGWTDAVVKPAVGTSSEGVRRVSADDAPTTSPDEDVLVQRFAPAIADGERSMVFVAGSFSHAWRSVPAENDFRSHNQFGGHVEAFDPSASVREDARAVLSTAATVLGRDPAELLYARVDGVERDGHFVVMELELVEPFLGLERGGAVERLATAIAERV